MLDVLSVITSRASDVPSLRRRSLTLCVTSLSTLNTGVMVPVEVFLSD